MSVQLENGYTKIANELYDAIIKWRLSSYEHRVLIWIIRKTYGWNKKHDWISLSQFQKGTNIPQPHICRALKMLRQQNMIIKGGNRNRTTYGIQKDYGLWIELPKGVRSHHKIKGGTTKGGNSLLPKGVDTKETLTKEIIHTSPAASVNNKKMKQHDPRKFDSDYEAVITEEGEKVGTSLNEKPNVVKAMRGLLKWAEDRRGQKFTNIPKQYRAMKLMRLAGVKVEDIKSRWEELEGQKFYSANGVDFMTVSSSFDRKP